MCPNPIIIAALIGVGGVTITAIVTSVVSLVINNRQRKAATEEKFFYEGYSKRLSLYAEVISVLTQKGYRENIFEKWDFTLTDALSKQQDNLHILDDLLARLNFYGSPAARNVIAILIFELLTLPSDVGRDNPVKIGQQMITLLKDARTQFLELCRKEAAPDFVDNRIKKINEGGYFSAIKKYFKKRD
jgi:hypothetical protein